MNLHEYQAKEILAKYGVPVPFGILASSPAEVLDAALRLKEEVNSDSCVIKAQIHAGGRGKGGGVKLAISAEQAYEIAEAMIGMQLVTHQTGVEGKKVRKVLVTENVYSSGSEPLKELYLSILLDRKVGKNSIVYSAEGGVDIEEVALKSPNLIFREIVEPVGLQDYQVRKMGFRLGLSGVSLKNFGRAILAAYNAYVGSDASLLEINPLLKAADGRIFAVDAKMAIDDNALFRNPSIAAYRDENEEDPYEVEAAACKLNFVKLDGNVGCMVNGAGLAMATMDIIKHSGGAPANFLDVGGGASAASVGAGFRIILKDPNVKAILINIFGGIVRCDRVAQGIVSACKEVGTIGIPVIVRLQGTNAIEGKRILDESGLKMRSATSLLDAANLIKSVVA
ncbi:ADP-forming succinate--CoA ligase subunit beta [uncultured Acetobacteroides sp.]|uniref:ADP-forming succinate--CoA ligase subunit beta n=1 Tax=uncultured Acetobacteroides sp. TaxID=1760811 RepID=UPI0029F48382|nr:ADP-forming succinate--CoA ligase subunit beta [uncultured Acetobacteroides sp.]